MSFFFSVTELQPDGKPFRSKRVATIKIPELVMSMVFILFIN